MKEILKLLILTIPAYIIIFFLWPKNDKFTAKDLMKELNQRDSIISKRIDDKGRLVIEHTNREYVPFTIKNSNEPEFVELRSELASLGIKLNDLKSAYTIQSNATGQGKTEIIRVSDTLDTYSFNDTTGKHLKINGTVDVKSGQMDYNYSYKSTYKIFSYDYKKNFLKRPELRLKIVSDDPSNDIQAQTFSIKPPREIVSLGVGIGGSLVFDDNKLKIRPSLQIGLYKPIFTFRSKK